MIKRKVRCMNLPIRGNFQINGEYDFVEYLRDEELMITVMDKDGRKIDFGKLKYAAQYFLKYRNGFWVNMETFEGMADVECISKPKKGKFTVGNTYKGVVHMSYNNPEIKIIDENIEWQTFELNSEHFVVIKEDM